MSKLVQGRYFVSPISPCAVIDSETGGKIASCATSADAERVTLALNRETDEDALTHALIAALKALHAANVNGGTSMADLRSIAIQKCREAVQFADGSQSISPRRAPAHLYEYGQAERMF